MPSAPESLTPDRLSELAESERNRLHLAEGSPCPCEQCRDHADIAFALNALANGEEWLRAGMGARSIEGGQNGPVLVEMDDDAPGPDEAWTMRVHSTLTAALAAVPGGKT